MNFQYEIDAIITAANQLCEWFQEAFGKFLDEINDAYVSMQETWEELQKCAYDCAEKSKKKAEQRKKWRATTKVILRPLLLDKRPRTHHCRNAC